MPNLIFGTHTEKCPRKAARKSGGKTERGNAAAAKKDDGGVSISIGTTTSRGERETARKRSERESAGDRGGIGGGGVGGGGYGGGLGR